MYRTCDDTSYNLSPGYKDFTNGAKTVYYKVTGGTYYNDATGSATVTVTNTFIALNVPSGFLKNLIMKAPFNYYSIFLASF